MLNIQLAIGRKTCSNEVRRNYIFQQDGILTIYNWDDKGCSKTTAKHLVTGPDGVSSATLTLLWLRQRLDGASPDVVTEMPCWMYPVCDGLVAQAAAQVTEMSLDAAQSCRLKVASEHCCTYLTFNSWASRSHNMAHTASPKQPLWYLVHRLRYGGLPCLVREMPLI